MEQALGVLDPVWPYFRSGFYLVNNLQGLMIGAVCALFMNRLWRLPAFALLASLLFLLLGAIPDIRQGVAPGLPPIVELSFWQQLLRLCAGYLIVIPIFHVFKLLVLRQFGGAGHGGGHEAHGAPAKDHHAEDSGHKGGGKGHH